MMQGLTASTNRITSGLPNWLVPFRVKHAISNTPGVHRPMGLYFHTGQAKTKAASYQELLQPNSSLWANLKY